MTQAETLIALAEQKALAGLTDQWQAGPHLPDCVLSEIKALEAAGLVERQFADEAPAQYAAGPDELHIRLSACWFFRLTDAGQSLRARAASLGEG